MEVRKVLRGDKLSFEEAKELFSAVFDGELAEPLVSAVISVMAFRGETPQELAAAIVCADQRKVKVEHTLERVVDTCGTGGDGSSTFNISTASSFILASLGIPVAKHGNRAVTGSVGSADIVEALGVKVAEEPEEAKRALEGSGFAFLFAPKFHPAFARVAPVRRMLGIPTVFNLLGPQINPCDPVAQLIGVYSPEKASVVAEALYLIGKFNRIVVCSERGIDEVDTMGRTFVFEVRKEGIKRWEFEAAKLLGREFDIPRVFSMDEALEVFQKAITGEHEEAALTASVNAAFVLYALGECELEEGFGKALKAVKEGIVQDKLQELRHGVS